MVPEGDRQGEPVDLNFLIHWLKDQLLKERPELFVEGGTVYVASYLHAYTIG
jgi:ubiquitin related modifier 1